ncbi:ABC-type multidrug transport system fused ATPase/permease subunit [Rhodococcus sp. SMB37]|uniref:ABC transporter ATP-binding protein n=1 Tax=Rhodococcus sp. SMB37 TaxID=2512213 RepID=UPI00104BD07A|nr:ABC transporter ATP-binding protein [Rhodococcus sp. SMB37]TCN52646.1 ABC-type multidrug transport system fused ATPase/permease subunit [Rhodococcus sp. SMB37]
MKLPVFFDPPPQAMPTPEVVVDDTTTPRRFAVLTMLAAKKWTTPAALLVALHQVCEALVPVVMGQAIDRAVATRDFDALWRWLLVLAAVFAVLTVAARFGGRIGQSGMLAVQHRMRTRVTDRILDVRGVGGPQRTPGDMLNIATSDVEQLARGIAVMVYPIGHVAAVVFGAVILLSVSWPLGLAILIGAPVILWLLDKGSGPLRRRSFEEQKVAGAAAGTATDLVTGIRVVKGIGADAEASRRYVGASRRALDGVLRSARAEGAYIATMEFASGLLIVGVAVAAGAMAVTGSLSVGQLITVVGVTQVIMGPLAALGSNMGAVWAAAVASAERVLSVLQAPPAVDTGDREAPGDGTVEFEALTAGHVHDLTLTIAAGKFTVVHTDAETTADLVAVLSRSRHPEHGRVVVGGVDLFDLGNDAARRSVRVVPHASHLFEGTVVDNIAAGVADAPDADASVTRAVFAAACDDVARVLPAGLDTPVGEAGRLLSGGQRQRVSLARALAAPAEVLVLVDPTTAVDSVTEATIAERLPELRRGRTTVVFTRSPAFTAAADDVLELTSRSFASSGENR